MSHNLFADLPESLPEELVEILVENSGGRIERIVSTGQASPPGFWYDQEEHEWVLLLTGSAVLRFEDQQEVLSLKPGDHIMIPAHRRHRVESTSPTEPTVWLAVFMS
ncbi:cupin domain-containing protein [Calycomorphotria hydatis]|uniref:Cupin domain protein n=1 Tax=Calycomorphotria hydatis TaxID=2528027 RepID=A0A517T796_9PLAN|nr:cupin domain-containing protein [Calycomorphotria hydatis]QDT64239.1 Cupin domain protein [Calycomorphotria hydatis]